MNHADKKKTEAEEGDFTLDDTVNPMQNSMQMTAAGDYDEESAMSTLPTGENPMNLGLGPSGASSTITSIYAAALHDHKAEGDTELTIEAGETLEIIKQDGEWWYGRSLSCGKTGFFPESYVEVRADLDPSSGTDKKEEKEVFVMKCGFCCRHRNRYRHSKRGTT